VKEGAGGSAGERDKKEGGGSRRQESGEGGDEGGDEGGGEGVAKVAAVRLNLEL
jgi:hypothetical protein